MSQHQLRLVLTLIFEMFEGCFVALLIKGFNAGQNSNLRFGFDRPWLALCSEKGVRQFRGLFKLRVTYWSTLLLRELYIMAFFKVWRFVSHEIGLWQKGSGKPFHLQNYLPHGKNVLWQVGLTTCKFASAFNYFLTRIVLSLHQKGTYHCIKSFYVEKNNAVQLYWLKILILVILARRVFSNMIVLMVGHCLGTCICFFMIASHCSDEG